MSELNRRDFLWLAASTGMSAAYAGLLGGSADFQVRTGIVGWDARIAATMNAFSGIREYQVIAFSNVPHGAVREVRSFLGPSIQGVPTLYADALTMLQKQSLDVMFASGAISPLLRTGAHLVLEGCDSEVRFVGNRPGRCIQILPKYEFLASKARTLKLCPNANCWTRAQIRHQTGLPVKEVRTQDQLISWMCSEIGEAVDFAQEMLGPVQYTNVTATAVPVVPAGTVVFGLRFRGTRPSSPSIEIAVYARPQQATTLAKTEISLVRETGSITFVAAPRSERLTRFLLVNMLDAVRDRAPSKLLYAPEALKASSELLASAGNRLGAVQ
jgi:hypothetical protein